MNRDIKRYKHIEYDDVPHTYRNIENGTYYKSVTSWISSIKYKFESTEAKTAKTRKKLNMTHEEVLALWKKKNLESTIRGTAIHKFIEDMIVDNVYGSLDNPKLEKSILSYLKKSNLLSGNTKRKNILCEQIVFNDELKLAGQSDLVLEYPKHLVVKDWKTNDKDFKDLSVSYDYYEEYFTEYRQCSYMDYVLQLCIYSLFLEKMFNKPVKSVYIVHIRNSVKEYKIDNYLVEEIKQKLINIWNLKNL